MDMKQLLDKLRPSASFKVKVEETWTVKMEGYQLIAKRQNIRKK